MLLDENNNEVGVSKNAAFQGISAVVISRVAMAVPGMSWYHKKNKIKNII